MPGGTCWAVAGASSCRSSRATQSAKSSRSTPAQANRVRPGVALAGPSSHTSARRPAGTTSWLSRPSKRHSPCQAVAWVASGWRSSRYEPGRCGSQRPSGVLISSGPKASPSTAGSRSARLPAARCSTTARPSRRCSHNSASAPRRRVRLPMRKSARASAPVRKRSPPATGQLRSGCAALEATQPPLSRSSQRTSPCSADTRPTSAGSSPGTVPARALPAGSQISQASSHQHDQPAQRASRGPD